jgi:hypothetical protein
MSYRFGLGQVIYRGGTSGVDRPRVTLASDIKELITQTDSIIDLGWVPG